MHRGPPPRRIASVERLRGLEPASGEPWEPRSVLHVHGPSRLPIRFHPGERGAVAA